MDRPWLASALSCLLALQSTACGSVGAGDFAPIDGRGPRTSAPAGDGSVEVHLSDQSSVLEHRIGRNGVWSVACTAPCDLALPRADEYRVTKGGRPTRTPFLITAPPGTRVTVDSTDASSSGGSGDGVVVGTLAGIGVVALFAGYVALKVLAGSDD
jgi:hypothetical protein